MDPIKLRPNSQRFPLQVETDAGPTKIVGDHADRTRVDLDDPEPTLPPDLDNAPTLQPEPIVDEIDRYILGAELGHGTFGRVIAARDKKLGRPVAIKLLHPAQAAILEFRQRFRQEAHAAACITHPGIVTIFDVGESAKGALYIAMELLAGESLQARVARLGRLPPAVAIEIGRQVASAVGAAHAAGVVHRDLKPENIFVVPDAAATIRERVKVLDFGLAKPSDATVKTQVATVLGTPAFMSPEQCRGVGVDFRTDIYSLGCILHQCVTGKPPFTGSLRDIITGHQEVVPPRLRDVDDALAELVAAMLAKDPARRPPSMAAIEQALTAPEPDAPVRPSRRRWFGLF